MDIYIHLRWWFWPVAIVVLGLIISARARRGRGMFDEFMSGVIFMAFALGALLMTIGHFI